MVVRENIYLYAGPLIILFIIPAPITTHKLNQITSVEEWAYGTIYGRLIAFTNSAICNTHKYEAQIRGFVYLHDSFVGNIYTSKF